jgi:SAM-dependent methyltransferase
VNAPRDPRFHFWDSYWQFDRLSSFDIDTTSQHWLALMRHWASFVGRIPAGGRVLDLGCGNGAAGLALLRAAYTSGSGFEIHGIDQAAIDPPRYSSQQTELLRRIRFWPGVQMEALPFEAGTFDAVLSQYAVEYGNLGRTVAEIARVLKPGGTVSILALPALSKVANDAGRAIRQAKFVLQDATLFTEAARILHEYHNGGPDREQVTRSNLDAFCLRVEDVAGRFSPEEFEVVSAVVTRLQDIFIQRATASLAAQLAELEAFRSRLAHYAARCQATTKAAVGDSRYDLFRNTFKKLGFTIVDTRSIFSTPEGVVAAQVTATSAASPPAAAPAG